MKHLFLLFLLIPVTLFAQVDKKYLAGAVPVVDDRVVFTEELNLPGRSQNDIFATLLQWATTRFITTEELQSRILYSDQDKGQIACMGQEYLVFTNKALSLDRAVINYQMFITCKPGKCELKVTAIRYQYNRGTAGQEIIPAEEQITDQHTLNKTQTKLIKSTGKFRIHTIDLVDSDLFHIRNMKFPAVIATLPCITSDITKFIRIRCFTDACTVQYDPKNTFHRISPFGLFLLL